MTVKDILLGTVLSLPLLLAGPAGAATLRGSFTADNAFFAYLATNDAERGTLVGQGNNWATAYSFFPNANLTLTPGTTYYLHFIVVDGGAGFGLAGKFSLSGTGFSFANGSTTSFDTTTTQGWRGGLINTYTNYVTPVEQPWVQPSGSVTGYTGPNGAFPGASWLWPAGLGSTRTIALSTTITADRVGPSAVAVPEPVSAALLGAGLLGLVALRRRMR